MSYKRNLALFSLSLAITLPLLIKNNTKNTCTSFFDYVFINFSENCYYNPDVDLNVTQLIKKYTGNVQEYSVTTEDGYILTMFRIYRKNPLGVVLLQPPISAGSIAWLSDGNNSLGFLLWKMGYDVWLTNHRGASYSRKHINLTESDQKFWDYSFHEIAMYDFDAQFELIYKETESKVIFIGYSMSATGALIYSSLNPERAEKFVKSFILIAPTASMGHFRSVFKYILYAMRPFEKYLRLGEFMTFEFFRKTFQFITVVPYILNIMTSVVMGWTPTELDPILYPYIFAHHGRGITNKMLYHYDQIFSNQSHFIMYDYGKDENKLVYGAEYPPHYPLEKIKNSMYIIYGDSDMLATPQDIEELCEKHLPKEKVSGKFAITNHNHIDFIFSRHRRTKTYRTVTSILKTHILGQN